MDVIFFITSYIDCYICSPIARFSLVNFVSSEERNIFSYSLSKSERRGEKSKDERRLKDRIVIASNGLEKLRNSMNFSHTQKKKV